MPRSARLDTLGSLHHVMIRGLERRKLFRDRSDREEFLSRLESALCRTGCSCSAWVLMPNHVHLLVRSGSESLSSLMRRILSGYAVYFNRRHKRHGYLYQNRYKSILCQEDAYFLELVRYIHLNPLRAHLVSDMAALANYAWSGHSAIVGAKKRAWQDTDSVLRQFGRLVGEGKKRYEAFVAEGRDQGCRPDLIGGGLRRSAGGSWESVKQLKLNKEILRGDARIRGNGELVEETLQLAEERLSHAESMARAGRDLTWLAKRIMKHYKLSRAELLKKGRNNARSEARAAFCYLGYHHLCSSGRDIAEFLGISQPAVSKAVSRGGDMAEDVVKLLS